MIRIFLVSGLRRCVCVCVPRVSQVESIQDQVREKLHLVQKGQAQLDEKDKNELKKRKLLSEV